MSGSDNNVLSMECAMLDLVTLNVQTGGTLAAAST